MIFRIFVIFKLIWRNSLYRHNVTFPSEDWAFTSTNDRAQQARKNVQVCHEVTNLQTYNENSCWTDVSYKNPYILFVRIELCRLYYIVRNFVLKIKDFSAICFYLLLSIPYFRIALKSSSLFMLLLSLILSTDTAITFVTLFALLIHIFQSSWNWLHNLRHFTLHTPRALTK